MNRTTARILAAAAFAALTAATAQAQSAREVEETRQLNLQQLRGAPVEAPLYGSQLMTPAEQRVLRDRLRQAGSAAERDRIRREHHAEMQARARVRGVTLPDEPPMMGSSGGMGRGWMSGGSGGALR